MAALPSIGLLIFFTTIPVGDAGLVREEDKNNARKTSTFNQIPPRRNTKDCKIPEMNP